MNPHTKNWEKVAVGADRSDVTERLEVQGGWLYRTTLTQGGANGVALCFVPKPRETQKP